MQYDTETLIPMMMSPEARESSRCGGSLEVDVKVKMEEEEKRLFVETFKPTKVWKKC